ncbi:MAG: prolyl oligopeptidase family serine peptidase, partial [Phycisphaerae bacterium]|nr:prolyl oligopeptidase family serine peptidase [Phycisphaerae bacterium]
MSARLAPRRGAVELHGADVTKPDVIRGETGPWRVGVPVINAGEATRRVEVRARVRARGGDAGGAPRAWGPSVGVWLAPLGVVKAVVSVEASAADARGEGVPIEVAVFGDGAGERAGQEADPIDRLEAALRVRGADEQHTRTFVSTIDGSVQYYAVVPAVGGGEGAERPGMVLSLHGAGVEATGQAGSYAGKPGLVIVCPTNRRPFGFDWEDWGRLDAVEVVEDASRRYGVDPERVYLTGHSMGGHGTWSIGTLMPHAFAAVAPSAGWLSFESYGGAVRFPGASDATKGMEGLLRRAFAGSDTQARMANLRGRGVYVLHGDADDNVPVREARAARAILERLQIPYGHHEEPGAGHWWDNNPGPGAACLDWPAIFEMFAQRPTLDASVGDEAELVLSEAGPVSMRERAPLAIDAQARRGERSRVRARVDRAAGWVEVETENAARVVIGPRLLRETVVTRARVDGGDVATPGARPGAPIMLERRDGAWGVASGKAVERAARSIPPGAGRLTGFKGAFDGGGGEFVLVYGTAGTAEENAWTLAKARFDAEQW